MTIKGLNQEEVIKNRQEYGDNNLTQKAGESLARKILNGFKEPMIIILLVALLIQVVLFILGKADWFEPVGILIAIVIANGVSAISSYNQEKKAITLKEKSEEAEIAKVIRDGFLQEIHVSEIVVGDIVQLQAGDKIPADGVVIDGILKVDQSALNGESEEAHKEKPVGNDEYDVNDLVNKHYVYRGTVIVAGEGYIEIKVVGDRTLFGKLALEIQEETRETPLQLKLGMLAKQISKIGYTGAIAIVAGIIIKTLVTGAAPADVYGWIRLIMDAVTVAVTIIVCAVPEGLPMLTSILLSFQSVKMAKDNVLVKNINGLETSGSLNILFSDKTGTITEGRLSVVDMVTGNLDVIGDISHANDVLESNIIIGIGMNNSAVISKDCVIGGNSTDRALMNFILEAGKSEQITHENVTDYSPFDSNKKYSTVNVKCAGIDSENSDIREKAYVFIKGAPEKILDKCTSYIDKNGCIQDIKSTDDIVRYIDGQAERSMRVIAVARAEGSEVHDKMTLVCIISIRDNVRAEAAGAIKEFQNAGIQVVMVTGDRKETATAIAKEAGIITSDEDVVIRSSEMAEMSDDELKQILPHLRVVSRALPTDKSRLVKVAQELDYVVGMTGDGVNDSPALKKADVGFAMGSGSHVAKEAGDITILDDNISSIEKAILYGRTMFKSIRKFLIFQLTVNVAAVLTCFLGPFFGENTVLSVIQLLLINLVMDTLAAIAFGSEPALKEYMKDKPIPRSEGIITKKMLQAIVVGGIYITFISLAIMFLPPVSGLYGDVSTTYLKSALFATFMIAITMNAFNARSSHGNPFRNIGRNKTFVVIIVIILAAQYVFVTFGGRFLGVESLDVKGWIICAIFGFIIIPIDMIRKAISKNRRFNLNVYGFKDVYVF